MFCLPQSLSCQLRLGAGGGGHVFAGLLNHVCQAAWTWQACAEAGCSGGILLEFLLEFFQSLIAQVMAPPPTLKEDLKMPLHSKPIVGVSLAGDVIITNKHILSNNMMLHAVGRIVYGTEYCRSAAAWHQALPL